MPTLQCRIETADMKGALGKQPAQPLTVGHEFAVQCDGESINLNTDQAELRLEKSDENKLKLLKIEKHESGQISLLVTSYRAGEHNLKAVQLVDSENSFLLGDLSFTVSSVLEENQEPFGPMGPIKLHLGWMFWLSLLIIVLVIASLIWSFFRKKIQRQKWLQEMAIHDSALTPVAEISKKLRAFMRKPEVESLPHLNQAFRIYIARKYLIPTMVWSDKVIIQDFKKRFPQEFKNHGSILIKTFFEINRALSAQQKTSVKDFEQIIELTRRCVEQMERSTGP
jgi:hypothetical protein